MNQALIAKYNIPGPRYTSYPTVPYWTAAELAPADWQATVTRSLAESNAREGISLYVHLPFCESLCTFCGCNKRITKNHAVERPYLESVLAEWNRYKAGFSEPPRIRELHLGGGTPTFFQPERLEALIEGLMAGTEPVPGASFSFEGNPNNTTRAHLEALYRQGFRRVSYGIQDFDPTVQRLINRVQPYEVVAEATAMAREVGYTSINYDIIFGLPQQRVESIVDTIEKVRRLRPDRIAYYSYAHVPWIKGVGQRGFSEADLPKDAEKRRLYEVGRQMLEEMDYVEIGMDHFALPEEELAVAARSGQLHRNFMGYAPFATQLMVGLGVSAIGDSWYGFGQNEKNVEAYQARVAEGQLPVFRGHLLNQEDLVLRQHILNIMCRFETSWAQPELRCAELPAVLGRLAEMEADGLVRREADSLTVLPAGRPFIRNVCMAFDARLWRRQPQAQLFSLTI